MHLHTTNQRTMAYLDPLGRVIASKEYIPAKPILQLSTPTIFHRVKWTVPDAGSQDFIAFYDHKPLNGDPDNFIPGSKILVFPFGDGGAVTSAAAENGKWAAYVMKDARVGISRSKILNEKQVP